MVQLLVDLDGGTDHISVLKSWKLDNRVKDRISYCSIYKYASELVDICTDCRFVSSLCNTYLDGHFHILGHRLHLGLQDILYLTGLPLDGKPVCGNTTNVSELVSNLLGEEKLEKGSYIKLKWLVEKFQQVPQECPDIDPYARAYLLFVIGCVIFPGVSKYRVSAELLLMLEDVSAVDTYAWGSALFAHLHYALDCIIQKQGNSQGRYLSASTIILEVFALEHLPEVATTFFANKPQNFSLPESIPLVGAWSNLLAPHSRNGFNRLHLDAATEISWRPYSRVKISEPSFLDHYKLCGGCFHTICLERISLYNYEDSVLQLGLPSPPAPKKIKKMKSKSKRGETKDWLQTYKMTIELWEKRKDTLVSGLELPELEEIGGAGEPEEQESDGGAALEKEQLYSRETHFIDGQEIVASLEPGDSYHVKEPKSDWHSMCAKRAKYSEFKVGSQHVSKSLISGGICEDQAVVQETGSKEKTDNCLASLHQRNELPGNTSVHDGQKHHPKVSSNHGWSTSHSTGMPPEPAAFSHGDQGFSEQPHSFATLSDKNVDSKEKNHCGGLDPRQVELARGTNNTQEINVPDYRKECSTHTEVVHPDLQADEWTRDVNGLRMLKFGLVDLVKDLLKPTWKNGHLSRETHKTIVKKVVDKVIGSLKGPEIPQTQEMVDLYLSRSRLNITGHVLAYVEKYLN